MKKTFPSQIILLSVFAWCCTCPCFAQHRGVQVRLNGKEIFETPPGKVITATFGVACTSDQAQEFQEDIQLPKGWKLVTPTFPFRLSPGSGEIRLVSFFVPPRAPAGKYSVKYLLRSRVNTSISDSASIFVLVQPVTRLQAKYIQAPDSVIAGETYETVFAVINESNIAEKVELTLDSSPDLPFTLNVDKNLSLAPGETVTVKVEVKTDTDISKRLKHFLVLKVKSLDDKNLRVRARSAVDIIPRITGSVDIMHRLPTTFRLDFVGQNKKKRTTGIQAEFAGQGPLDEAGKRHVNFLFRGPDTMDECQPYGHYDRYFAGYKDSSLDLLVGDDYYTLSRLTEQDFDGRGGRARFTRDNWNVGAYYMHTLRTAHEEKDAALFVDYTFFDKYRIETNLFKKKAT